MNDEAIFEYKWFDNYFQDDNREDYFIKEENLNVSGGLLNRMYRVETAKGTILWDKNDNPVIIDLESSGLVNPSMEVIDIAWNWSGGQEHFDKEKFKLFVNTYKENGGDLSNYSESLKADYKAKFGWLEYNLKRITGIECIDNEEKKLGERTGKPISYI